MLKVKIEVIVQRIRRFSAELTNWAPWGTNQVVVLFCLAFIIASPQEAVPLNGETAQQNCPFFRVMLTCDPEAYEFSGLGWEPSQHS